MRWWVWTLLAVFAAWQGYSLYMVWVPEDICRSTSCVEPAHDFETERFDLCFFASREPHRLSRDARLVLAKTNWDLREGFEEEEVTIPMFPDTRAKNGTVYLHVRKTEARPKGCEAASDAHTASVALIKFHRATRLEERFLVGAGAAQAPRPTAPPSQVSVAHWTHVAKLRIVIDSNRYERSHRYRGMTHHEPYVYFDELHLSRKSLVPLSTNASPPDPKTRIRYVPTSVGVGRMLNVLDQSMTKFRALGFSEDETDELLQLMSPDRLYVLILTYVVSFLHTLFAALAFKNDVEFWSNASDMYGLSKRSVIGNAVCSVILFLFLYDSPETSWLILATLGVGALVEVWKMTRVMGWTGAASRRDFTAAEKETNRIDAAGMRYLWYLLWPAIGGWAVYSLLHHQHRSWYSWLIASLANGGLCFFFVVCVSSFIPPIVYGFGFLMMWPQIFVNYQLKSVAHLPWRALTYKIFSTFVDDIFAWVIAAPMIHRLATMRDDVVFFVYLYQRFAYRVDKTRANEFGHRPPQEEADAVKPKSDYSWWFLMRV